MAAEGSAPAGRRAAIVIGRWGDDTALLRTADGQAVEVSVPESLRDSVDVGARADLRADGGVDWHVSPSD